MKITVNGSEKNIDNFENLEEFVGSLFEKNKGIIVELNDGIIHRDQWKENTLKEGDIVELIHFIGGG